MPSIVVASVNFPAVIHDIADNLKMRQLPVQRLSVVLWSIYAGLASGSPAQPTITSPPASEISRRQDSRSSKLFGYAEEGGQCMSRSLPCGLFRLSFYRGQPNVRLGFGVCHLQLLCSLPTSMNTYTRRVRTRDAADF